DRQVVDDVIGQPVDSELAEERGEVEAGRHLVVAVAEVDAALARHGTGGGVGRMGLRCGGEAVEQTRSGTLAKVEESIVLPVSDERNPECRQLDLEELGERIDIDRRGVRSRRTRIAGFGPDDAEKVVEYVDFEAAEYRSV